MKYLCLIMLFYLPSCMTRDCPTPNSSQDVNSNLFNISKVGEVNRVVLENGVRTEDAFISTFYSGVNYGADYKNYATAWTYSFIPAEGFFLLKFDFSNISRRIKIISARLTLFADTSNVFVGSPIPNKTHYGVDLKLKIKNLASDWSELNVVYNNKPQVFNGDSVIVNAPLTLTSSVIDIDVAKLVQKQLELGIYGFEIRLKNPTLYKRAAFYSSNSPNITQRPKLEIVYQ